MIQNEEKEGVGEKGREMGQEEKERTSKKGKRHREIVMKGGENDILLRNITVFKL